MSLTLSPSKIALLALRRIRHVSWFETGGEGPALSIALEHLDMLMAQIAGTERLWWLVKVDVPVEIDADTEEYDLAGILNPDAQDVIEVAWIAENGRRDPLCMYRLRDWNEIEDRTYRVGTRPEGVYVEHTSTSKMRLYPIPTEAGTVTLTIQAMAADISSGAEDAQHGAPAAWQRYFVLALAADIGAGPIERLGETEINRLLTQAREAKMDLLARGRRENVKRPRMIRPWDVTA